MAHHVDCTHGHTWSSVEFHTVYHTEIVRFPRGGHQPNEFGSRGVSNVDVQAGEAALQLLVHFTRRADFPLPFIEDLVNSWSPPKGIWDWWDFL